MLVFAIAVIEGLVLWAVLALIISKTKGLYDA